jgi:hypothetical protein
MWSWSVPPGRPGLWCDRPEQELLEPELESNRHPRYGVRDGEMNALTFRFSGDSEESLAGAGCRPLGHLAARALLRVAERGLMPAAAGSRFGSPRPGSDRRAAIIKLLSSGTISAAVHGECVPMACVGLAQRHRRRRPDPMTATRPTSADPARGGGFSGLAASGTADGGAGEDHVQLLPGPVTGPSHVWLNRARSRLRQDPRCTVGARNGNS